MRIGVAYQRRCDISIYQVDASGARHAGEMFGAPQGRVGCRGFWPIEDCDYLTCDVDTVYRWSGGIQRSLSHPLFGDLHGVCAGPEPDTFYVASSEADAVLLMTWSGELLWAWWADEHGYEARGGQDGHGQDFRQRGSRSAQEHSAHPNCAFPVDGGVLFSVFGPMTGHKNGRPVWDRGRILKAGPDTAEMELRSSLLSPHGVRLDDSGDLCYAESARSVVVRGQAEQVDANFAWAKCVLPFGDGLLVGCEDAHLRFVREGRVKWSHKIDDTPFVIAEFGE